MGFTKKNLLGAQSREDGITFSSKKHKGYEAVATLKDGKEITLKWQKSEDDSDKYGWFDKVFIAVIFILSLGKYTIWIPRIVLALNALIGIVGLIYGFTRIDNGRYKGFHGAEHMVINAYNKLGRVPTLNEIVNFSRFHSYCGTNVIVINILSPICMIISTFMLTSWKRIIAMIIISGIFDILRKIGALNFMQLFSTKNPDEKEMLTAIAGLSYMIDMDKIFDDTKDYDKEELKSFDKLCIINKR